MQASQPPYNDSFGHTGSRPSLPSPSSNSHDEEALSRLTPSNYILQPTTYAPPTQRTEPEPASAPRPGARNQSSSNHRWSASTSSSRRNSESASRGQRSSSVDKSFFLATSPSSSRTTRKLQKHRRPSDQSRGSSSPLPGRSPTRPDPSQQTYIGLPSFERLPSLAQDYSTALEEQQQQPPNRRLSRSLGQTSPNTDATASMQQSDPFIDATHREQAPDSRPNGHSRGYSGKGSNDSTTNRSGKPPSQKAMLSHALQKANVAVQLDNNQDIWGARQAYGEACSLLQNVLQRTSAQEDKRKLDAIVSIGSPRRDGYVLTLDSQMYSATHIPPA